MNNFNYVPQQKNQFSSYFNPVSVASASTNNIVWVQGIEGAKAWQLAPNSMIILLDSEAEGKMYIKVSDNIGMSSLRIFNYTEVMPQDINSGNVTINKDLDLSQYVRKDELINLVREVLNEQSIPTVAADTDAVSSIANDVSTTKQPKIIYSATNAVAKK